MQHTSIGELSGWLSQLHALEDSQKCQSPAFIKPFHLATLAHVLRKHEPISLTLPEKITSYANTMNLWGALNIAPPVNDLNRKTAGRYHPIELLNDVATVDDSAQMLVTLFEAVCTDAKTNDAVCTMLRELIGNCYAHSAVTDGVYGVLCAQVWAGGRKAQIALADSGIGIRNSLLQNELLLPRLNAENACELATEYGVTSKPGRGHSGYGLAVARKLLEQNKGVLIVRSGQEGFCLSGGVARNFNTETVWNGTLLVIEWDLDVPMNIREVYDGFPMPEGMNDDDFDF